MTRAEITSALALFGFGCFALMVPALVLVSEREGWTVFLVGTACLSLASYRLRRTP